MLDRIRKDRARRLYNEGKEIKICPVNMSPASPWGLAATVSNSDGKEFDRLVHEFIYYNCDAEAGRYPAFYVEREVRA